MKQRSYDHMRMSEIGCPARSCKEVGGREQQQQTIARERSAVEIENSSTLLVLRLVRQER
ncbi:hypothetical protein M407DRAFT_241415 [Tulasnella calospora MUT 4182]|uniref:Uncharacterized protein n=1 Tax=Tulasnella calospora MUT 4182 TaxID=1051891 RepID=A0A0C3LEZ2_9AGAM|nr:hypothetical protein M407DRAFT_241415 [Tulasnella calospora MUT 4182]